MNLLPCSFVLRYAAQRMNTLTGLFLSVSEQCIGLLNHQRASKPQLQPHLVGIQQPLYLQLSYVFTEPFIYIKINAGPK